MSENTLVAKIKSDADAAVAAAKAEGAAAVSTIERETEMEVDVLRSEHEQMLKKRLAHLELVAISKAKQDANIALQQAKRNEVDSLFATVITELAEQPTAEYVSFFGAYASRLVPSHISVNVVRAPEGRIEETVSILEKIGITGEVVADRAINAGFVVDAKDGVYDVTLNRFMQERRAELEIRVIEKLNA